MLTAFDLVPLAALHCVNSVWRLRLLLASLLPLLRRLLTSLNSVGSVRTSSLASVGQLKSWQRKGRIAGKGGAKPAFFVTYG
jgi:hypothetical protein